MTAHNQNFLDLIMRLDRQAQPDLVMTSNTQTVVEQEPDLLMILTPFDLERGSVYPFSRARRLGSVSP